MQSSEHVVPRPGVLLEVLQLDGLRFDHLFSFFLEVVLLPVPHEAAAVAVRLRTNGALVRTDSLMEVHVIVEHFRSDEGGIAGRALKGVLGLGKMTLVHPFVSVGRS